MTWKPKSHPIERVAIAFSAVCLGGATAFAILSLVPRTGILLIMATLAGGLLAGWSALFVLDRIGQSRPGDGREFRLPDVVEALGANETVSPWIEEEAVVDELLLDDPIASIEPDSRVVQLFEREQPAPLPEPGELVARIADYLDSGRSAVEPEAYQTAVPADASAALHAALADIRQSLRR